MWTPIKLSVLLVFTGFCAIFTFVICSSLINEWRPKSNELNNAVQVSGNYTYYKSTGRAYSRLNGESIYSSATFEGGDGVVVLDQAWLWDISPKRVDREVTMKIVKIKTLSGVVPVVLSAQSGKDIYFHITSEKVLMDWDKWGRHDMISDVMALALFSFLLGTLFLSIVRGHQDRPAQRGGVFPEPAAADGGKQSARKVK